ncbi:C4-dicarboxylate transporter DctM subunit [Natronocella acetinitrilica]|uniref:TRAP transporter large permease protein n=1 Tax=Natronocella acetinitrilica TaxID=414046 RepID=A0AAE3KAN5_9GAMM|nr:TRAP transporter large permease [Natronocella acetinitrilica]MCP1673759.1 C4-dicarboxylate transporter DctM subunit [Natronocella acetinitrilica]
MPAAILLSAAIALIILSFPIFLALLAATIMTFETVGPPMPSRVLAQRMVEGVNVFALLAVPLFIFAADIIGRGQIGRRLVALMEALVGHLRGGLAIATVLACAMFGAISGIGAAAVVSIGPIVYPALLRAGYDRGFAVGLILSASTLAMMIPPGVAMILYSVQTSTSVARVFLAGLSSGVLFVILISAWAYIYAVRNDIRSGERAGLKEVGRRLLGSVWALGLPVIIFGGIYGGVFTPTEAAAAACVYAAFVETVIYRQIKPWQLIKISQPSAIMIATLLILIAAGSLMTWYLTLERVPAQIAAVMSAIPTEGVLAMINVVFLMAGMFIDPNSAVIVLAPLIQPAAMAVGLDPVHLGAVLVFNLAIGMITPPFGLNIFIGITTFRLPYLTVVKSVMPFIGLGIVALLLITYIPILTTWLPRAVHG